MDHAEVVAVYRAGDEDARMTFPRNAVEWRRTRELLVRWLPGAPARVLDIGGASGRYAGWLRELGYAVRLIDLVPEHVAQARARGVPAVVGDARRLPAPDGRADAVLLLGPLYHLVSGSDRAVAWAEAARVCRPGGLVVAAGMSRWAKPAVHAARGELGDPETLRHLSVVLESGHDADGDAHACRPCRYIPIGTGGQADLDIEDRDHVVVPVA